MYRRFLCITALATSIAACASAPPEETCQASIDFLKKLNARSSAGAILSDEVKVAIAEAEQLAARQDFDACITVSYRARSKLVVGGRP
jgi:preprotein translocase subunit Sec63